jgi:hypothetical protein
MGGLGFTVAPLDEQPQQFLLTLWGIPAAMP